MAGANTNNGNAGKHAGATATTTDGHNAVGKTLTVTYIKSAIGYSKDQKATIRSLGFKRLYQTLRLPDTPQVRGQINKVKHLVKVEKVEGGADEG